MDLLLIWLIFIIFILLIFSLCWSFYKYFVKLDESTIIIAITFIISLSTCFALVLFIPIDIYLVSKGNLEISKFEINQIVVYKIYHLLFWCLIFQAYVIIPYVYFYFKNKNNYRNEFDDDIIPFENAIESLKKTIYFIFFVAVASIIGLMYRPGHKISMEKGKELEYIAELLDTKHTGESAILFLMGCVVLIGVSFWVSYTSYGIACLPLSFLQQKNINYEKKEIENHIMNLKEKERMLQIKYNANNKMNEQYKNEMLKIENMKRILSKYNYKLQEIEKLSETWFSYILKIVFTFRVLTGLIFLIFSFIIYISLLASIVDKYYNSICAYKCGFVLEQINSIFNLLDTLLIFFSKFFPLDIFIVASLAIYIFCCSLYGVVNVGIRLFFIPIYKIKPKNSSPDTLLIVCFIIIHIILVLIMTLLTIAPNYITYGVQTIKLDNDLGYIKCSLRSEKSLCKMSVISVFFNKIFFGIPYFANSYFFSNWMFLTMFTFFFIYNMIFAKTSSYFDQLKEMDIKEKYEENISLLPLETLT